MVAGSFVVWLDGSDHKSAYTSHGNQGQASRFARIQMQRGEADEARIYFVSDETRAPEAIGIVKAGKGVLIGGKQPMVGWRDISAEGSKVLSKAVVDCDKATLHKFRLR